MLCKLVSPAKSPLESTLGIISLSNFTAAPFKMNPLDEQLTS
jgi:hypothetical protein